MTWKTHIIGGMQAGIVAAYAVGGSFEDSAIIVCSAVLGSVLPDIDQPNSKIARSDSLVGLVSFLVSRFTKHRGFTHTIAGSAVMAVIFYLLAMFRTEKESIISFFAAMTVFLLVHVLFGPLSRLAGWAAVATYTAGPQIASFLSEKSIDVSLNSSSARLWALGIFVGCLSHIIYDGFNKGGVMALHPITMKRFRVMDIKTRTIGELGFAGTQMLLLAGLLAVCCKDLAFMGYLQNAMDVISACFHKSQL